jgi:nucleoside-diphosphate-sugar epimerase
LVRDFSRASRIARFDLEMLHGEVSDAHAVRRAVSGCDVVFHCAYGNRGDESEQRRINVDATALVAAEALGAGVRRMVHVSTIAAYGRMADGDADESSRGMGGDLYAQSKREAECLLLQMHCQRGLPVVIVQPTCVYGPYGLAFTIDPLQELRTRQVALVNGGKGLCSAVYVDDVADALLLAADQPAAAGEAFIISGEAPVSWKEFYAAYETMLGGTSTISITAAEMRVLARQEQEAAWRVSAMQDCLNVSGIAHGPAVARQSFRVHGEYMLGFYAAKTRFRIDKAKRMLGYQPAFDLARGMQLTEQWARWAGLIPREPRR